MNKINIREFLDEDICNSHKHFIKRARELQISACEMISWAKELSRKLDELEDTTSEVGNAKFDKLFRIRQGHLHEAGMKLVERENYLLRSREMKTVMKERKEAGTWNAHSKKRGVARNEATERPRANENVSRFTFV